MITTWYAIFPWRTMQRRSLTPMMTHLYCFQLWKYNIQDPIFLFLLILIIICCVIFYNLYSSPLCIFSPDRNTCRQQCSKLFVWWRFYFVADKVYAKRVYFVFVFFCLWSEQHVFCRLCIYVYLQFPTADRPLQTFHCQLKKTKICSIS